MYDGENALMEVFLRKNVDQKKRARRISTETRSSLPSGQFLLWKEEWALAKSLSLEYWWKTKTSLVDWNGK